MELTLTNNNGETLDLLRNENYFILTKAENMHGLETDIATTDSPYLDGTLIENVKALPRGISLTFKLIPDIKQSIDFFTSIVKTKQYISLTETENKQQITIKGIATISPYSRMMASCELQLDIYCGQPYWEDVNKIIEAIAMSVPLLNFPVEIGQYFTQVGRPFGVVNIDLEKTFYNQGDVSVGMHINITANGDVLNPRISCSTGNQNGWYMQLNLDLKKEDTVEIDTTRGSKSIKINGQTTIDGVPILSLLTLSPTATDWLQLETGKNTFNITATSGEKDLYFTISYKRRYE